MVPVLPEQSTFSSGKKLQSINRKIRNTLRVDLIDAAGRFL